MSDNSHSTGSSGSSTNSWTLLSPEEAAVENVGPVDDGTESLGDVPSLSEEITGASGEFKPSNVSVESILSEEGHQVCQETSPESGEGPIPSSPSRMSPLLSNPADLTELESQPPVIHDIVTTSPSDHELLGATPFVTSMDLGVSLDIPASELLASEPEESPPQTEDPITTEQELDKFGDAGSFPAGPAEECPVVSAEPVVSIPTETLSATVSSTHVDADISSAAEGTESSSQYKETLVTESLIDDGATKEKEKEEEEGGEEEEEAAAEYEEVDQDEKVIEDEGEEEEEEEEPSSSFDLGDTSGFDDGLRRRNIPSFDAPRPRTSDEEDDEEEVEFKLAEKKEEKSWLSVNKCIVGALILLFLGSLFLSGDFDDAELSDGEQSQDWLSSDPQDMKELLDKLTQENQQIAQLEAQLQSQKEQLDLALQAVASSGDEAGKAGLEIENTKLRAELSSLPELKKELESLKARVTELSQLTADQEMPPATSAPQSGEKNGQSNQKVAGPDRRKDANKKGHWKEELKRQKILLEESGKRLDGMKKNDGDRKKVRDNLEAIQKKLSEKVDRWGEKKEPKRKGDKARSKERDHWKKDEKKKRKGEKEWKHGKEGVWREKEEKKEKERKQNSHKEAWRKHQDEWERKKGERKMDREERRKEKPWHNRHDKNSHHHHHHHQHHHQQQQQQQRHQNNQNDFWRDQEEKLRRSIRPQLGCSSSEDCAGKEGLYPVELPEFDELLEGYLSKLERSSSESKDKIRKLTAEFFEDGVFIHDRVRFSHFAEDVADILEDMVDVLEDGKRKGDDSLEEEMEEFEREALWKFSATA